VPSWRPLRSSDWLANSRKIPDRSEDPLVGVANWLASHSGNPLVDAVRGKTLPRCRGRYSRRVRRFWMTRERERTQEHRGDRRLFRARPLITVLGVKYLHLRMEDGTDLYVTEYGLPFTKCLCRKTTGPMTEWMKEHSRPLPGTSAVHRVKTKEVDGRSKEIVIKWNRMGQDIPGETRALDAANAEFNSPFMEFSLVIELRNTRFESPGKALHPQAAGHLRAAEVRQGRTTWAVAHKMEAIQRTPRRDRIDWNRNYAVIYEWLKGIDAVEACREGLLDQRRAGRPDGALQRGSGPKGLYRQRQQAAAHHRSPDGRRRLVKDRRQDLYGLVDFELLKRTPEREEKMRAEKRHDYLVRQAHRFESARAVPARISPRSTSWTSTTSTDEWRARAGRCGSSVATRCCSTTSCPRSGGARRGRGSVRTQHRIRDGHQGQRALVWRVSRVGQIPDADPFVRAREAHPRSRLQQPLRGVLDRHGAVAQGIETTYPRAIYMTGHRSTVSSSLVDNSRYESHADFETPDGHPMLSRHHEYLTIWGYWNGPDDVLAVKDEVIYNGIDALAAYREGRSDQSEYVRVMRVDEKAWPRPASRTSASAAITCCCRSTAISNWPWTKRAANGARRIATSNC
jgi:hypothetical protein